MDKPKLLAHVPAMNGMRGLAAMSIFLFHAGIVSIPGAFIGVDVFFVLSGFLISVLLIQEYQAKKRISFKYFYLRRILRLFPALFCLMGVIVLYCIFVVKDPVTRVIHLQDVLISLCYAANWTRAFDLGRPIILGHCWSLSIEEQFYLLWPLVLFLLMRRGGRYRNVCIGLLILASWTWRLYLLDQGASWNRLYNGFDCRGDMILYGCLLGSLWNTGSLGWWQKSAVLRRLLLSMAAVLLIFIIIFGHWQSKALYRYQYTLVGLSSSVLILELVSGNPGIVKTFFSFRPFVWMGNVSYGFYLWHFPVMHGLWAHANLEKERFVATAFFLTVLISMLSWFVIEKNFLKLKNRYASR